MEHHHYQNVLDALTTISYPLSYEDLLNTLKELTLLNEAPLRLILDELLSDQVLMEYDRQYYFADNVHYAVGTFRVVREQFGFVENDAVAIYIASNDFNDALDLDTVLIQIIKGERSRGVILGILHHEREYLLGTMEKVEGNLVFIPYDTKIFHPIRLLKSLDAHEHDRVVGKINYYGKELEVDIISILGQKDEPGMDVLSVLFVYGIDAEFAEEVLDEADTVAQEVQAKDTVHRVDHRDQYVITIDGEDAKDLDDAVYMEALNGGYRLYVHIADVSHYVRQHSLLDQSAYERASSVYMVDRVVPMLPKVLSNGVCSLHPNVDRLTLTVQIDVSDRGEILDYHIYESVIRSHQRLSYQNVNKRHELGEAEAMVLLMLEAAQHLNNQRSLNGSIDFDSDESQFVVDDTGRVLDIFRREQGEAEQMIEAFMVLANEVVARYTNHLELPVLYRIHEEPNKEKLQELSHTLRILGYRLKGSLENIKPKQLQQALHFFEGKPEYPVVSKLILRSMSKARYSEQPIGHFGLALDDYTHFTSPIRRYPDLLLHQRLKKYSFKQNYHDFQADETYAQKAALHVSKKERAILEAERQVEKIKKAEYMKDKIGQVYTGYVSGVNNYGLFVELENTVEGQILLKTMHDDYYIVDAKAQKIVGERHGTEYALGKKVRVKVSDVDEIENSVHFILLKRSGHKQLKPKLKNKVKAIRKGEKTYGRRRKKSQSVS